MKTLLLMSGLPGSGKSYTARTRFPDAIVISSDEIRLSITGSYREMVTDMNRVYDEMIRRANEILEKEEDVVVLLDSTFLDEKRRLYFLDRIHGQDETVLLMLLFHDYQTILIRNRTRREDKWVPEEVIAEMAGRYKAPNEEEEKRYTRIENVYID